MNRSSLISILLLTAEIAGWRALARRSRRGAFASLAAMFVVASGIAQAADLESYSTSSGDWSDANIWSTAHYPNNGNGGFTYHANLYENITLDVDVAVNQLTLGSGTLSGPKDLTVEHNFRWLGGNLAGTGAFNLMGASYITGRNTLDGVVDNYGDAVFETPSFLSQFLTGTPQAVWNNRAGATAELRNFALQNTDFDQPATFHNHAGATFSATGDNQSTVSWYFQNDGETNVESGQLRLYGDGVSSGSMNVSAGARLSFGGDFTHTGDVVSAGIFEVSSVTSIDGAVTFAAGSSYVSTGLTHAASGALVFDVSASLNDVALNGGSGRLDGSGNVTVNGSFDWNSGELAGEGEFNLMGASHIIGRGDLNRVVNNYGDAVFDKPSVLSNFLMGTSQAVWNNRAGATAELRDFLLNATPGQQATFHNHAGAALTVDGDVRSTVVWALVNDGEVEVENGQLFMRGGGVNRGAMNVQSGADIYVDNTPYANEGVIRVHAGGAFEMDSSSSFTNAPTGTFHVEGDAEFIGPFTNGGHVLVESGGNFTVSGGLYNPGFSNAGVLEVRDGSATIQNSSSVWGASGPALPPDFNPPATGAWFATLNEGTWIAGPGSTIHFEQLDAKFGGHYPAVLRQNHATVVLDGVGSEISTIDSLWFSTGTVEIRGGRNLSLSGETNLELGLFSRFDNSGTVRVGDGSELTFTLGIENAPGSQLAGEGVIVSNKVGLFAGGVRLLGTTISSSDTLTINSSIVNDNALVQVANGVSTIAAGTLAVNGPMSIVNGGHLVIAENATLGGSGELHLQNGLLSVAGTLDKPVLITSAFEVGGTLSNATLDGASLNAPNGAGFGLIDCFGQNEINSGIIAVNGQLLINPGGTLVLGAGASVLSGGAINVLEFGDLIIDGHLASTGHTTVTGTLAVSAGGQALTGGMNVGSKGNANVKGKLTSTAPMEVMGTLAIDVDGEIDVPHFILTGIPTLPASLTGMGKINGDVHAGTLSTISPGNSPGTLTVGNATFAGNSALEFEIRDALGISGVDYDLLVVEGDLTNTGTSSDPMSIRLATLDVNDETGMAANFDGSQSYSWTLASVTGAISGFAPGTYSIDADGFLNDLAGGHFALVQQGGSLTLQFNPVPGPGPQTRFWINADPGDLLTDANWSDEQAPNGVDHEAVFNANPTNPGDFTLDGPMTLGTLKYDNSGSRQITGTGTLTFQTSGDKALFHATESSGDLDLDVSSVVLASTTEFRVEGTAHVDLHAPISGGGGLVKTGEQRLVLHGDNDYDGVTFVNDGTLQLLGSVASDNAAVVVGGVGGKEGRLLIEGGGVLVNDGDGSSNVVESVSVNLGNGYLGLEDGSHGEATVAGTGSAWTNTGDLILGGTSLTAGTTAVGTLEVLDSGAVAIGGTTKLHAGGTITVDGGTFSTGSLDRTLGAFNHYDGAVRINGGEYSQADGPLIVSGNAPTANPLFELVDGATTAGITEVRVGDAANRQGELLVSGGALTNSGAGYLGYNSETTGEATVAGEDSTWTNSGFLYVGLSGNGFLNIENGGAVSNTAGFISAGNNSEGTATVTGENSTWTSSSGLYVGYYGKGFLNIEDGGAVSNTGGRIASGGSSSEGTAAVIGAGSTWTNSANLDVGFDGKGFLNIENGGVVSNTQGRIAVGANSEGTATVTGAGSTWTNAGNLILAGFNLTTATTGVALLTVEQEGLVSVTGTTKPHASGTITVNGGTLSTGSLDRTAGAFNHHDGTVRINGGTYTQAEGALVVSGDAAGKLPKLELLAGATTTGVEATVVGNLANQKGELLISGGSTLVNSGSGSLGTIGSITVTRGDGYVGLNPNSQGKAIVTGTGSTWENSRILFVGRSGVGELLIADGGSVKNTSGWIGYNLGSQGTVTVSDSSWENTGSLIVGDIGQGVLNIINGGFVKNAGLGGRLGTGSPASSGTVHVSGAGSKWENAGNLYVGGNATEARGAGSLTIDDDGLVTVAGANGATIWSTGALRGAGGVLQANVVNHGLTAPGASTGVLTIDGDYTQSPTGDLQIELAGATVGSEYDRLVVTGLVALGGTLSVQLIDDFMPTAGQSFDILNWGSRDGMFSLVDLPPLDAGLGWDQSALYSDGVLSVIAAGPGDFNLDGIVDGADFLKWQRGESHTPLSTADLVDWKANFGPSVPPANNSVPEPTAGALLLVAALVCFSLQRKRENADARGKSCSSGP